MSHQKIPGVGRANMAMAESFTMTATGVMARDRNGNVVFFFPCAAKHQEQAIELFFAARSRSAAQIDFSFLKED